MKDLHDILVTLRAHLLTHSRKLNDPYILQVGDGLQYRVREVLKDLEELEENGEYIMYHKEDDC